MGPLETVGVLNEFDIVSSYGYHGVKLVRQILPYREEESGDTKYEQWHDGMCIATYKGRKAKVWLKTVICKTVKTGNVIERLHAIGFWEDRASLKYIPVCQALDSRELKTDVKLIEYINEYK